MNFKSDLEKKIEQDKYNNYRTLIIKYLNKVDRPVLIGELSLLLKIGLDETEKVLSLMSNEDCPSIRSLSIEEESKFNRSFAYVLTSPASLKLANN